MEQARKLRENAGHYLRLLRFINAPADVARLEALATEANRAAAEIEDKQAAQLPAANSRPVSTKRKI